MQYLHPIKTQEQVNAIYNFINNDMENEKNWEIFFKPEVTKYLEINEELFDETKFFQDVRKVLIQKMVIKTIQKNLKKYYKNEERIEKINKIKIILLTFYIILLIIAIFIYSAITLKRDFYIMRKLLYQEL